METNYYLILGLPPDADGKRIRERFHELARSRHPDRLSGEDKARAELEFQQITEAFNVLSDPERRRQHDFALARPEARRADTPSESARVYMKRGVDAFKAGSMVEAADCFQQATEAHPDDAKAWYALSRASSKVRGRQKRALAAAERAVRLESMNPGYLKLAGTLAAQAGLTSRAERYLDEALTWGGDDERVSALLADLREKGKRGFFGRGR